MKNINFRCPCCRVSNWRILFTVPQKVENSTIYFFYRCQICGLIRLHPSPKALVRKNLYSYSSPEVHNQALSPLMKLVYLIPGGQNLIAHYVHLAHKQRHHSIEQWIGSGRLLDVGCGTGEFLTLFDPKKWKLTGVEVNPHLTKSLKANFSYIHIITNTIETFIARNKFEVITLWHVLEHLTYPEDVLKKLKSFLAPNGWLFIEVPQANSLSRILFRSEWNLLLTPEHTFFWTARALSTFLSNNGFVVKQVAFRGFMSSFTGSLGNWLHSQGVPRWLATTLGVGLSPIVLIVNLFIPSTRDNLFLIAQKATP